MRERYFQFQLSPLHEGRPVLIGQSGILAISTLAPTRGATMIAVADSAAFYISTLAPTRGATHGKRFRKGF